jgi:hypothetical protein
METSHIKETEGMATIGFGRKPSAPPSENETKTKMLFKFSRKTKIFAKILVKRNFAKFRFDFAFRENLKKHFRFNPTWEQQEACQGAAWPPDKVVHLGKRAGMGGRRGWGRLFDHGHGKYDMPDGEDISETNEEEEEGSGETTLMWWKNPLWR